MEPIPHMGDLTTGDEVTPFEYEFLDADGVAINISVGYTIRLQGRSRDDHASKLDEQATIPGAPTNRVRVLSLGTKLALGGGRNREPYLLQFRVVRDSDGKPFYSERFTLAVTARAL